MKQKTVGGYFVQGWLPYLLSHAFLSHALVTFLPEVVVLVPFS